MTRLRCDGCGREMDPAEVTRVFNLDSIKVVRAYRAGDQHNRLREPVAVRPKRVEDAFVACGTWHELAAPAEAAGSAP